MKALTVSSPVLGVIRGRLHLASGYIQFYSYKSKKKTQDPIILEDVASTLKNDC